MRTIISHFYNEEYLLPWWIRHHVNIFDHGILINHGSNDRSVEIIRELAPHWQIVHTTLNKFDGFLTDLEVMNYERNIPGWKIALNTTEFLASTVNLDEIEKQLEAWGKVGCAASGYICVDKYPEELPSYDRPLLTQKHWGIDDNEILDIPSRLSMELSPVPLRNRFYHKNSTGMYQPGRHSSYHHDYQSRLTDLMVFHFGFSPWNDKTINRKTQIAPKITEDDKARGWGGYHLSGKEVQEKAFDIISKHIINFYEHPQAKLALQAID